MKEFLLTVAGPVSLLAIMLLGIVVVVMFLSWQPAEFARRPQSDHGLQPLQQQPPEEGFRTEWSNRRGQVLYRPRDHRVSFRFVPCPSCPDGQLCLACVDEGVELVQKAREILLPPNARIQQERDRLQEDRNARIARQVEAARVRIRDAFATMASADPAGVEIVDAKEAEGRCGVCKSAFVRCLACGAVHHAECWTEAGGCSAYGCKGRKGGRV